MTGLYLPVPLQIEGQLRRPKGKELERLGVIAVAETGVLWKDIHGTEQHHMEISAELINQGSALC